MRYTLFCENCDRPKFLEIGNIPLNQVHYICESCHDKAVAESDKPAHYAKGIDTFARMEANRTTEECLAFAIGNIDKYNWRTKGQDIEDFEKIKAYADWAIKLLRKELT